MIFLSYARVDWDEYALPLVERLRGAGLDVWVDQDLIRGGDDWMDAINAALKTCDLLVLCVSPEALNSRYVKMEYRYFFHHDKPIVPVLCRPADLPAELVGIQYWPYGKADLLTTQLTGRDRPALSRA